MASNGSCFIADLDEGFRFEPLKVVDMFAGERFSWFDGEQGGALGVGLLGGGDGGEVGHVSPGWVFIERDDKGCAGGCGEGDLGECHNCESCAATGHGLIMALILFRNAR